MQSLLKSLVLIFIFCLNLPAALINDDGKSFSELLNDPYRGYNRGKDWGFPYKSDYSTTLLGSNIYVEFIGNEFVRIDNNYYRISQKSDFIFNLRHKTGSGYNLYDYSSNQSIFILQYYSGEFEQAKIKCWVNGNYVQTCGPGLSDAQDETFSYFNQWYIEYKATCDSSKNEIFSKKLSRCVSCPAGQSWDDDGGKCFIDCTDKNKNKWGFTDGSCADCSGEKDSNGVKKCYCNFIGSKPRLQSVEIIDGDFYFTSCENGSEFWYKKPGTPDSDDNKTKPDPNNPNPGGGSGGDSGGGSGGDSGGALAAVMVEIVVVEIQAAPRTNLTLIRVIMMNFARKTPMILNVKKRIIILPLQVQVQVAVIIMAIMLNSIKAILMTVILKKSAMVYMMV